jgi:DNA-binding transcriptional LysR family regulator
MRQAPVTLQIAERRPQWWALRRSRFDAQFDKPSGFYSRISRHSEACPRVAAGVSLSHYWANSRRHPDRADGAGALNMSLANIDLNLIKVLHALLEERSVSRAGARIGRSQPAVSSALARLRLIFHDPLLVRVHNSLQLTPRAKSLEAPVRQIMQSIDACIRENSRFVPAEAHTTLRVSAPNFAAISLLPTLMNYLSVAGPNIKVQMFTEDGERAVGALLEDRSDIAIGVFRDLPSSITAEDLFHEIFVCLFRKNHPLAERDLTWDTLLEHNHVIVNSSGTPDTTFDRILAERGMKRRSTLTTSSHLLVPEVLARTDLVAVLTQRVAEVLVGYAHLQMRPLPPKLPSVVATLAWHQRSDRDPACQWMREKIKATLRENITPKEPSTPGDM